MQQAEVTHYGIFDMQVCVPQDWDDAQVIAFAQQSYPCGTRGGWSIRRQGDRALGGDPERVKCIDRKGFVHLVLDA